MAGNFRHNIFVCMDVFHRHVNEDICFRKEILENKEEIFLLNHIGIVWQRLVDTIHNRLYDNVVNIDEDHSLIFDHMYHHKLKRLPNTRDFHILFFRMDTFAYLAVDKVRIHLYDKYVYIHVFDNSTIVHKVDHIESLIHYNFVLLSFFHIDMIEYSSSDMVNILPHGKLVHIDAVGKIIISSNVFHMTNLCNHIDELLDPIDYKNIWHSPVSDKVGTVRDGKVADRYVRIQELNVCHMFDRMNEVLTKDQIVDRFLFDSNSNNVWECPFDRIPFDILDNAKYCYQAIDKFHL